MIRTPLRPLARVIAARSKGQNPDEIEAEERAKRNLQIQSKQRRQAESRLVILALCFLAGFCVVGGRMSLLAWSEPREPRSIASDSQITTQRADIIDINGSILATNIATVALYAQPPLMVEPEKTARQLVKIFPDLKQKRLVADFTGKRKFLWIKKKVSPDQRQRVHDLGEPGLLFGQREMRLYPNGNLAAHILGGSSFGREGVAAAEVIGVAGVEKQFDTMLRDPTLEGKPLQLSIDLPVQAAMRQVLHGGMKLMSARAAGAVLMDVKTGGIISMVSLPDFDPNDRPRPLASGEASDSPLFNRVSQGRYELGSTFKLFAVANSLERGLVNPGTMVNTQGPIRWGKFKIRDFHDYGRQLSVTDVVVKSSNVGTARLATAAGTKAQQDFLDQLGFFEAVPVELGESGLTKPLLPKNWSELSTMTISYGHGLAATPLHLAAAYATITNGGFRIRPTLLKNSDKNNTPERVLSERTSRQLRVMLRAVVTRGTASYGEVPGYEVGGKTGSADKPKPRGGYYKNKVMATFVSIFPSSAPKYVLVVTLDEPSVMMHQKKRRTAGWTAVPVAAEIIARLAPLLDMRPKLADTADINYIPAGNQ